MAIASSYESGSENCHIFGLWLSQWRLAILDWASAKLLLVSILNSMRGTPHDEEAFWLHLQEFFNLCDQNNGVSRQAEENPNVHERLIMRVNLLAPQEAKRLLQHLSCSSSLNEDSVFWDVVWKALNQYNPGIEDVDSQFNQVRQ